jgi:hypothetical protein
MPYSDRIATLIESHRLLDKAIKEKENDPDFSELKLKELKKQKLKYKDEIRKFEKAQEDELND